MVFSTLSFSFMLYHQQSSEKFKSLLSMIKRISCLFTNLNSMGRKVSSATKNLATRLTLTFTKECNAYRPPTDNDLIACEFQLHGKFTVLRYTIKRLVENFKSRISNYDKEKEVVLYPKIQHFTSWRFKLLHCFPAFYNFNVMVIWSSCNSCDHVKIIKFYKLY